MKKPLTIISTIILTACLTGCVTPETTPVIKAETVAMTKPMDSIMTSIRQASVKALRQRIVKQAVAGVGVPYVFSGASKSGWDCSGFTVYVFGQFGIKLEHSATKQAHSAKPIHKPQIGDLVAFSRGRDYYHVGIYVGHGKVANANSYYGRTLIEPISNYKGDKITYINVIG